MKMTTEEETWVSTGDRGEQELWIIRYSPNGLTTINREDFRELMTKAGLRLNMDVGTETATHLTRLTEVGCDPEEGQAQPT
jgi:hypothetical protein